MLSIVEITSQRNNPVPEYISTTRVTYGAPSTSDGVRAERAKLTVRGGEGEERNVGERLSIRTLVRVYDNIDNL